MKKLIAGALLIGFSCLISPALAGDAYVDAYVVNSGIYYKGALIDTPTLLLLPGREGAIERSFGEDGADQAYRLAVTVKPIDETSINLAADLELAGDSLSLDRVLKLGQPARVKRGAREFDFLVEKSRDGSPSAGQ